MIRSAATVLTLVFTVALVQIAHGRRGSRVKYPIAQAEQRANGYWATQGDGPACGGLVTVSWANLPNWEDAAATWTVEDGGAPFDCSIAFNANHFLPLFLADWPEFCTATTHEFGHLHGNAHSPDPTNVMYPSVTSLNLPAVCDAAPKLVAPTPRRRHGHGSQ